MSTDQRKRIFLAVSRALARAYAYGWKQHARHVGEVESTTTPDEWADANAHAFSQEAEAALLPVTPDAVGASASTPEQLKG